MRYEFEKELNLLHNSLIEMSEMVSLAITKGMLALREKDEVLARQIMEADSEINQKERDIERQCFSLLLKEQPVASDLRLVSSALKMITDLERIGDQAADICAFGIQLFDMDYRPEELSSIFEMSEVTIKMTKKAVQAFAAGDTEMAVESIEMDDKVDEYFDRIQSEVIEEIRKEELEPEKLVAFLMIAKYLERIADHAQNIAEWVLYSITGEMKKFH